MATVRNYILFSAVVLKLVSAVLLGSAKQFVGDSKAPFKKLTRSRRKKICYKKLSGNLFSQSNLKDIFE